MSEVRVSGGMQAEAARCALTFLEGRTDTNNQPMKLLRLLANLTLSRITEVGYTEPVDFATQTLVDAANESDTKGKRRPTIDSEWVSRHCKELIKRLERSRQDLEEVARRQGFTYLPDVKRTPGGGPGNPSLYWIEAVPVSPGQVDDYPVPEGGLRYRAEQRSAGLIDRTIFQVGVPLTRTRKWIVGVSAILVGGFFWLLVFIPVVLRPFTGVPVNWYSSLQTAVSGIVVCGFLFWAIMGATFKRVIAVPPWISRFTDVEPTVLEFINHRRKDPDRPNEVQAVRYVGICPTCEGTVGVSGGGLRFWGRLVGRCEESPREHVYSFDHVTRTGYPLTAMGYPSKHGR